MFVEIVNVDSKGLIVRLKDGTEGFVPRKELSWSRANPSPFKKYRVGQRINVVRLRTTVEGHNNIYSIRKLTTNPWVTRSNAYDVGNDVIGKVTSIFEDAVTLT